METEKKPNPPMMQKMKEQRKKGKQNKPKRAAKKHHKNDSKVARLAEKKCKTVKEERDDSGVTYTIRCEDLVQEEGQQEQAQPQAAPQQFE